MSSLGTDPAGIGGGRPHAQNKDIPPHLPTTPLSLRPGFLGTELGVSLHKVIRDDFPKVGSLVVGEDLSEDGCHQHTGCLI